MERGAGILMPISALPCKYGIGSFGDGAYMFMDFLKSAGQKYWQVLPLVQTGYGDSPYQSVADNSGNPYFIDLEILHREGLITKRELQANIEKSPRIDYGKLYEMRYSILRKAFSRFNVKKPSFVRWCKEGKFADYACFMALKQKFPVSFYDWPNEYKYRNELALKAFCKEKKTAKNLELKDSLLLVETVHSEVPLIFLPQAFLVLESPEQLIMIFLALNILSDMTQQ